MEEPEKEEKTKEEPTNNDQPMEEKKNKNLSIKLILGIIILLLILFLFSIGCQEIQKRGKTVIDTNMQAIYPQEQIMEYGTHLTYQTILEKLVATNKLAEGTQIKVLVNDKLLREGEEYTLDTIGYLTFTVETSTPMPITSFLKQEVKASEQVVWKVEDTKKPVLSGVENKEIKKGEALDVKAGITAKDEVDGELPVTVEGTFDNNQVGEYTLTAKAVDKNQNEVTQTFTVTVKEETKKETTNTKNTSSNKTTTSKTTTNKTIK